MKTRKQYKTHYAIHGGAACGVKRVRYSAPFSPHAISCGRCRRTRAFQALLIDVKLDLEKRDREVDQQAALTSMLTRPVVFARRVFARATM